MKKYRGTSVVELVLIAMMAAVAPALAGAAAAPPPASGAVTSQSYDKAQLVTETHLQNGLTILTKEVHGAPVVYFSVWYHVGSRNEISGQTGLSHILEHMMFKGTHDLPPGAIDHLFQMNGGEINADTGTDRTSYHELISADRLELAVRVEADRMENSAFDPIQLKHEMTVVRSELEGDSNDPGYQLYDFSFLPAEFIAHPYHWPTLGWKSDVEAVADRRDVIYRYYRDHYMPNNATVVIVGDFDTKKAVALCQRYFGVYPAGHLETHYITPEPAQHGERRVVLRRPGSVGSVLIGYHAPPLGVKDHYVMDVMVQILSGGRSARLYQALVEKGIAESASAGNDDAKDPFVFTLSADDRSGVSNDAVEQALEAEVTRLQQTSVTAQELRVAFKQIDAGFTYENDSVSDQASEIGTYASILSYRYLDTYLGQIHRVTAADIQRVAKQYLIPDNRTVATFEPQPLPPGQEQSSPPVVDNFGATAPVTDPKQAALLAALDKRYNSSVSTAAPTRGPAPVRVVLPNGLTVIVEEKHTNHTVAVAGSIRAGSMYDPSGRYGVADLTAEMLSRGTTTKSALDLASALESVGATLSVSASTESTGYSGECLAEDTPLELSILADELRNPAFAADELDKLRGETLSALEQERQDTGGTGGPGSLASIAFAQALFPKGHPYWAPSIDDSETAVKSITTDDVRGFYSTFYRPDTAILVIVGDVRTALTLKTVRGLFGDWPKPATAEPSTVIPDVPVPSPSTQVISIPGTMQTSIVWGYPGQLKRASKDFYAATIMNYVFGGDTFGSRLGKTIRDRDGLAYTVGSYFDAEHGAGPFQVFVGTNPENVGRATAEIRVIAKQMLHDGVTAEEVREAKEYLTGSYPLRLETNAGIADQLLVAQDFGLGLDYPQRRAGLYNSVTVGQVNDAMRKYLLPNKATLIIAGAAPGR